MPVVQDKLGSLPNRDCIAGSGAKVQIHMSKSLFARLNSTKSNRSIIVCSIERMESTIYGRSRPLPITVHNRLLYQSILHPVSGFQLAHRRKLAAVEGEGSEGSMKI